MRLAKTILLALFILISLPAHTLGWNKPGHMVTGAIAYYELKAKDPVALATTINLLKSNPYYQSEWLPRINGLQDNDPNKHDLYIFMYAARWPDDVRGTPLHCEKCHYINYPFKPAGQPSSVTTVPPASDNILKAYSYYKGASVHAASVVNRARALCWVFHLVGDIHQPLHTSTLFTVVFPIGDRGGTRFYISPAEDADTLHLHAFWDGLIIQSQRFNSVRNRARGLGGQPDLQRNDLAELTETRFERWAKDESFPLARGDGYLLGQLEGSPDETDGAVLPEDYGRRSKKIAERRVVLAGYRLADILSDMF